MGITSNVSSLLWIENISKSSQDEVNGKLSEPTYMLPFCPDFQLRQPFVLIGSVFICFSHFDWCRNRRRVYMVDSMIPDYSSDWRDFNHLQLLSFWTVLPSQRADQSEENICRSKECRVDIGEKKKKKKIPRGKDFFASGLAFSSAATSFLRSGRSKLGILPLSQT